MMLQETGYAGINIEIIGIMLTYAILNGLGSLFFKIGLDRMEDDKGALLTLEPAWMKTLYKLFKNPLWTLGLILFVSDFFVKQIALEKYEISVVAPLINLNLIFVITFGVFLRKEKISKKEIAAMVLIILGAFSVTYQTKESQNPPDIPLLIIFCGILASVVIFIVVSMIRIKNKNTERKVNKEKEGNHEIEGNRETEVNSEIEGVDGKINVAKSHEFFISIVSGILYGLGGIFNKALLNSIDSGVGATLTMLAFFGLAYGLAFLYGQYAYSQGRMSMVSTLVNIISISVAFAGGIIIFGDSLIYYISIANSGGNDSLGVVFPWSFMKLIGFALIISGILLAHKKEQLKD